MRDLLLTAFTFGLVPFILLNPHIGVLAWSWLSYMNPHRLTWGFAYNMPFAEVISIATLISIALTRTVGCERGARCARFWMYEIEHLLQR